MKIIFFRSFFVISLIFSDQADAFEFQFLSEWQLQMIQNAFVTVSDPLYWKSNPQLQADVDHLLKNNIQIILGPQFDYRNNTEFEYNSENEPVEKASSYNSVTQAINLGLFISLIKKAATIKNIYLNLSGQKIKVNGPQDGIIFLAENFFKNDFKSEKINSLTRARILAHEAKHSECKIPQNCGYPHVICKSGNLFSGRAVCDSNSEGTLGQDLIVIETFLKSNQDELKEFEKQKLLLEYSQIDSLIWKDSK